MQHYLNYWRHQFSLGFFSLLQAASSFFLAPIAFLLVFVFARGGGFISAVLSSKPCAYLGKISYSIYMMHMFVGIVFGNIANKVMPRLLGDRWNGGNFAGDGLIVIYLGLVILTAHISYH